MGGGACACWDGNGEAIALGCYRSAVFPGAQLFTVGLAPSFVAVQLRGRTRQTWRRSKRRCGRWRSRCRWTAHAVLCCAALCCAVLRCAVQAEEQWEAQPLQREDCRGTEGAYLLAQLLVFNGQGAGRHADQYHFLLIRHDVRPQPSLQAQPDITEEELQQMNPLAALLRSLLPWVNIGQAPPEGGADGGDGGGDAAPGGA